MVDGCLSMFLLLLFLAAAAADLLNPRCDSLGKTHPAENFNEPVDYIFLFDRGLIQAKSEQWRYIVKAMTCNLLEHTDVKMAVTEKQGDDIIFDRWVKPSDFEARLHMLKGNPAGDVSTCPKISSLTGLPLDPKRLTHLVVLVDTNRTDDCDLDSEFERLFRLPAKMAVLDRVHVGPPKPSRYLKIEQHWEDIDVSISTLPDDHSFANLANQDSHESLQDQIWNWVAGRLPQWARTKTANMTVTIVPMRRSLKEKTTAPTGATPNGTEGMNTTVTIGYSILASNSTLSSNLSTTVEDIETTVAMNTTEEEETATFMQSVTIIGILTNGTEAPEAIAMKNVTAGTITTGEGPAAMVLGREEDQNTTEATTTTNTTMTTKISRSISNFTMDSVMKGGPRGNATSTPPSTTTEEEKKVVAEFWVWMIGEWQLLLWIALAILLLICVIGLCCCLICMGRDKQKDQHRRRYQRLGGELYPINTPGRGESSTTSSSDPAPRPAEQQSLLSTVSMDDTQQRTQTIRRDREKPSTLPLSNFKEPTSEEQPSAPVPHPVEGAEEPYSPALPSPFDVRHSEVAVTPVRSVSSFTQRLPVHRPAVLPAPKKNTASPKSANLFDL